MFKTIVILISMFCCFYFDNENLFNLKINSVSLFHAIIVGVGTSLLSLYNQSISIEYNDNFIYQIFPLISFGYSFYDLYIGIRSNQFEYILHGAFLILLTTSFYYIDALSILNIPLTGEISTIFLNLRPIRNDIIDLLFVITFTWYRIIFVPIVLSVYVYNSPCMNNIVDSTCTTEILIVMFFVLFSALNIYWFYYICKKVMRRINRV
jgi:hypothetical protein